VIIGDVVGASCVPLPGMEPSGTCACENKITVNNAIGTLLDKLYIQIDTDIGISPAAHKNIPTVVGKLLETCSLVQFLRNFAS
jgi:hypothetical protein